MMRKSNRLLLVLFTALALCACTNHDSDYFTGGDAKNGSSESGGGEEVKDVPAVLVVAPFDKSAAQVADWGADLEGSLANSSGLDVAVGFTGVAEKDNTDQITTAAEAAAGLNALDPKPTRVIVFELVAYGEGKTATDMETEVAAAIATFDPKIAVERVNGFGYGDFMTNYLAARLAELTKAGESKGLIDRIIALDKKMRTITLAESVLIVPVKENPEVLTAEQLTALSTELGVKSVVLVQNDFNSIVKVLLKTRVNIFNGGHKIIVPYLASPDELLLGLDRLDPGNAEFISLVVFNWSIIDDDLSFSVIDPAE